MAIRELYSWIKRNRKWVFSGIGVVPVYLIFNLLVLDQSNKSSVQDSESNKPSVQDSDSRLPLGAILLSDTLTLEYLHVVYKATPPLQREVRMEYFRGLVVQWKLTLGGMTRLSESTHGLLNTNSVLMLLSSSETSFLVSLKINPDDYPGIALLAEGDSVLVKGEISKIDVHAVNLTNVEVTF